MWDRLKLCARTSSSCFICLSIVIVRVAFIFWCSLSRTCRWCKNWTKVVKHSKRFHSWQHNHSHCQHLPYCCSLSFQLKITENCKLFSSLVLFNGIHSTQANGVHLDICANLRLCILLYLGEAVLVRSLHYEIVNYRFILLHFLLPLRQPLQLEIDHISIDRIDIPVCEI